jgi:hypothetical protein
MSNISARSRLRTVRHFVQPGNDRMWAGNRNEAIASRLIRRSIWLNRFLFEVHEIDFSEYAPNRSPLSSIGCLGYLRNYSAYSILDADGYDPQIGH